MLDRVIAPDEAQLARQKQTWNSEPKYHTEEEMAAYFRSQGVRAILEGLGVPPAAIRYEVFNAAVAAAVNAFVED